MASMASIRDTFFEECEDLLAALADGLAAMEAGANDSETVNAVFRAVHSIKGGAGAFALTDLVSFAHGFETVLDAIRSGGLAADGPIMLLLQRSSDHLCTLVEAARDDSPADAAVTARFLDQLDACLGPGRAGGHGRRLQLCRRPPRPWRHGRWGGARAGSVRQVRYLLSPPSGLFANGHDPSLLLSALAALGGMEVDLDLSALPEWGQFDPDTPYHGLETSPQRRRIRNRDQRGLRVRRRPLRSGDHAARRCIRAGGRRASRSVPGRECTACRDPDAAQR